MRSARPFGPGLLALGALVFGSALLASPARAQNTANFKASCNGTAPPQFEFGLAVQASASSSDYKTIAPTAVNNVLNRAECECAAETANTGAEVPGRDLFLRVRIVTPLKSLASYNVFAGSSCNLAQNQNTTCESITAISPSGDRFISGNPPIQPVPVKSLVSPGTSGTGVCDANNASNSIYYLFGDISNPDYCSVTLPYHGILPDKPRNPRAGSGDEAISLDWDAPATGTTLAPTNYQVLCADENGAPIGAGAYSFGETQGERFQLGYTTCTNAASHTLQRRVLPQTSGSTTTGDMGTTTTSDAGVASPGEGLATQGDPEPTLSPQADPEDLGGVDLAGVDLGSASANCGADNTSALLSLATLDKKFVVSTLLEKTATSTRVSGLKNNTTYYCLVVGIDAYGNARPSDPVCARPQPVEDLWRRYLSENGKQQGFCFIATAAYGSYQSPFVMVLRDFRDQVLLPTSAGAAFVDWYYRTSPPIADWIRPRPWARFVVRCALWPVITAAGLWMWLDASTAMALGLLVVTLLALRRARRGAAAGPAAGALSTAGGEA